MTKWCAGSSPPARATRPVCLVLCFCALMAGSIPVHAQPIDAKKAAAIKASCLYHLASLVTWPEERFENSKSPVVVVFLGKDRHGVSQSFESQARSFSVRGRPLSVKKLARPKGDASADSDYCKSLEQCHLLFVTESGERDLKTIIRCLGESSTVTVGESKSFVEEGGMVAFAVEGDRLTIHVDLRRIENARLNVGTEFLQHAKLVEPEEDTGEEPSVESSTENSDGTNSGGEE